VLEKLLAGARDPAGDEACRTLAREIIGQWRPPRYRRGESAATATMLQYLERMADPALVNQFIREALPRDYQGTEGEALSRLCERLGWDQFAEALTHFVASQLPDSEAARLGATAVIVEALCSGPGKMTSQRKAACRAVAAELERTIRQWDAQKERVHWGSERQGRKGVIESLARALSAVGEGGLLKQFLAHALADKGHYDLHAVLVPAVKTMYQWTTRETALVEGRQQILEHCIAELGRLTEKPVQEPKDWAQAITLRCQCADCQELRQFLRDPKEKVHRFRVAEARRRHLHQQIDSHGCDMTHVTERTGSPYTLVCTKNRASYDRKKAEFEANGQLLAELRGLVRPKRKK
jgi:hypothetical protein